MLAMVSVEIISRQRCHPATAPIEIVYVGAHRDRRGCGWCLASPDLPRACRAPEASGQQAWAAPTREARFLASADFATFSGGIASAMTRKRVNATDRITPGRLISLMAMAVSLALAAFS
jgi:hypothetical protein